MSWTNLTLASCWSNVGGFPNARVRVLSGISNAAELEGYLSFSGGSLIDTPITNEGSLPAGSYDGSVFHSIGGRCYDSSNNFVGNCDILIQTTGTLGVFGPIPSGTVRLYFGDIYPTS